jgi:hypothetical protein
VFGRLIATSLVRPLLLALDGRHKLYIDEPLLVGVFEVQELLAKLGFSIFLWQLAAQRL